MLTLTNLIQLIISLVIILVLTIYTLIRFAKKPSVFFARLLSVPKFQLKWATILFMITIVTSLLAVLIIDNYSALPIISSNKLSTYNWLQKEKTPNILTADQLDKLDNLAVLWKQEQSRQNILLLQFTWICAWMAFFIGILVSYRTLAPIMEVKQFFFQKNWAKAYLKIKSHDEILNLIIKLNTFRQTELNTKKELIDSLEKLNNRINSPQLKMIIQNVLLF